MNDPFESPLALMEEAKEGIEQFQQTMEDYGQANRFEIVFVQEPGSPKMRVNLRLEPFPRKLQRKAYRIVADSRHALDQACYCATLHLEGKVAGKKTYFPCSENAGNFAAQFGKKGRAAHLSAQLHKTLTDLQPWWSDPAHGDGNDRLRHLIKIAGPQKHEVSIKPVPKLDSLSLHDLPFEIRGEFVMGLKTEKYFGNDDPLEFTFYWGQPIYITRENVCFLLSLRLVENHLSLDPNALFALEEMMLEAESAVKAIRSFALTTRPLPK